MKVKIRPNNLPEPKKDVLRKAAEEYFFTIVDERDRTLKEMLVRRMALAMCLALSDQYSFDSEQCQRAVDAVFEIILGVCDDVYDRKELNADGVDKAADNMAAELADRGIEIVIRGDDRYDDIEKIRERKEKAATGAGTHGSGKE